MKQICNLSNLERRLIAKEYAENEVEGVDKAIDMCNKLCGYDPQSLDISVSEMIRYLDERTAFLYGLIAMQAFMES